MVIFIKHLAFSFFMELYYATTNPGKFESMQRDAKKYLITLIQFDKELPESDRDDVEAIAKQKVLTAYEYLKKPVVALDAGLYIYSLNGWPGALVHRELKNIKVEGFIEKMQGKSRECEFRECAAYLDSSLDEPKLFIDAVKGRLIPEKKGFEERCKWSKLDLMFIPESSSKTLAEMTLEEREEWRKMSTRDENASYHRLMRWLKS